MADQNKSDSAPLVDEANAIADAAVGHVRAATKAADEFLTASKKFSLESSEVVGGAFVGSAALAAGIWIIGVTTAAALALPAITVAGIGAGIIAVRGRRGFILERERRNKALQGEAALDPMRQLRGEIAAAQAVGAPQEVIASMWRTYDEGIAAALLGPPAHREQQQQQQLRAPNQPLALPPGRPVTPDPANPAQDEAEAGNHK